MFGLLGVRVVIFLGSCFSVMGLLVVFIVLRLLLVYCSFVCFAVLCLGLFVVIWTSTFSLFCLGLVALVIYALIVLVFCAFFY